MFFILRCRFLFVRSVFSKFVIKNGVKERTIYFYDKGVVKTEIRTYKCKKCGKKFNTEIVEENSNFTHDFKSGFILRISAKYCL